MNVAAIVLNYCNWQDTAACVESLLTCAPAPQWIVIVDNASPDDSIARLIAWAASDHPLHTVENSMRPPHLPETNKPHILLIRATHNAGYAAGNNMGLTLGMALNAKAFWILNNDTKVAPDSCKALYDRLFACPRPGLVGGLIRYWHNPDIVQCRAGGYTDRWTMLSRLSGNMLTVQEAHLDPNTVERGLNFIYGACVMASRTFVESVGLMDEKFFLYCEEQDWAWRAKGRFDLAYAPAAHIFHKEGASTGMSVRQRSFSRLLLLSKNRIRLAAKHYPHTVPTVLCGIGFAMLRLAFRAVLAHMSKRLYLRLH